MTREDAEKALKAQSVTPKFIGEGDTVTAQVPAHGQTVPGGSEILLYLGEAPPERMVEVPDFTGMNRGQASDAAGALGLYILISGNPSVDQTVIVTAQSIAPGTKVPAGTTIRLEFTDTQLRD